MVETWLLLRNMNTMRVCVLCHDRRSLAVCEGEIPHECSTPTGPPVVMRSRLLARREPAAEALAETLFPPQFSLRPWRAHTEPEQEAPVLSTPVVSTS